MKNCLLVLVAGAILCVPFGCDRGTDEDPVAYDRDVDGPPVGLRRPLPDYEIIGSPSVVRDRRQAFRESTDDTSSEDDTSSGDDTSEGGDEETAAAPAVPASEDEAAEVKAVIEKVLATKDAEDDSEALAFFDEDAATAVGEITRGVKDIQAKALALDAIMDLKFGAKYPEAVREKNEELQTEALGPSSVAEVLGEISINQLVFSKVGEKIEAKGSSKDQFVFSKTADGWKIGFEGKGQEKIDAYLEVVKGAVKMLEALSVGVEDGSITADDVESKVTRMTRNLITPAKEKLKAMGVGDDADADDDDTEPDADDDEDAGDADTTEPAADDDAGDTDTTEPAAGDADGDT